MSVERMEKTMDETIGGEVFLQHQLLCLVDAWQIKSFWV